MNLQKKVIIFGLVLALVSATGCSSGKKQKEETVSYYAGQLSEAEMDQEHISLQLSEKVSVDADITPYSKYKDGLNSYLTETAGDNEKIDIKSFEKNPEIFGKSFESIKEKILEMGDGKYLKTEQETYYKKKYKSITLSVPYVSADGKKYVLQGIQNIDKKLHRQGAQLDLLPWMDEEYYEGEDFSIENLSEITVGSIVKSYAMMGELDTEGIELAFASQEEAVKQMKEFIVGLTGMELADDYDFAVVTKENYETIAELAYEDSDPAPLKKEYYVGFFRPALDGLPWKEVHKPFDTAISTDASEEEQERFNKRQELLMQPREMAVCLGEDGLLGFEVSSDVKVSDIYGEKKEICPISEIISGVQEYFSRGGAVGTLIPVNIVKINLVYAGDVTEDYQSITTPYWSVRYTTEMASGTLQSELIYDAVTGELLAEQ